MQRYEVEYNQGEPAEYCIVDLERGLVLGDVYEKDVADKIVSLLNGEQAALDAVLKEAVWAMDELDVYLSHDHEASFADRLHAQAFLDSQLDSQIVRDYRARQEQG